MVRVNIAREMIIFLMFPHKLSEHVVKKNSVIRSFSNVTC